VPDLVQIVTLNFHENSIRDISFTVLIQATVVLSIKNYIHTFQVPCWGSFCPVTRLIKHLSADFCPLLIIPPYERNITAFEVFTNKIR
jgi:hypothetical protein